MEFQVFLRNQDFTQKAPHKATSTLANLAITRNLAKLVGPNVIQLTRSLSWKEVKRILRGGSDPDDSGILNAPNYHTLPYTYPLPMHILRCYERA